MDQGVDDWQAGPDDWTTPDAAPAGLHNAPSSSPKPSSTGLGSFGRGAARGVAPAIGGLAAGSEGAEIGGALGLLGGPFAEMTVPVGAFLGGLGGAYLGSYGVQKAQDKALSALPEGARKTLGQDEAQQQADLAQHPYASMAGELAPNLALMRPGKVGSVLPKGAPTVSRILASPVGSRAAGATIMGGQEAATEEYQQGNIDPAKVAIAAGAGAVMNKPTRLGRGVIDTASTPRRVLTNIASGKPANAPPDAGAAPSGPDDWTPEAPQAIAQAKPPQEAPGTGEAIGVRFKNGPPQRATVDHYFDSGNAVRLRMDDGTVHDLTTADMLKSRTEAPEPMPERPPVMRGPALTQEERAAPPLEMDDWTPEPRRRPPSTAPLGGEMLNALDHADGLERTALNQSLKLSAGSRQDMLAEAARLRRQFGHAPDESVPPNAYRHPMTGEPAADLGDLARARAAKPDLYDGKDPADDAGKTIPEAPETFQAQQAQLKAGQRPAMLFPKQSRGTIELPVPAGMKRAATKEGVFHYDPKKISAEDITAASKAGTLNKILALGDYSKADILARVAAGEKPLAVTERTPDGVEVRAAAGTDKTSPDQLAYFERSKTPGNVVRVEGPEDVIRGRIEANKIDPYALEDVQRARAPATEEPTLFDAIRKLGGIKDDRGDVAQIMQGFKNPPFVRRVLSPNGLSPDRVREALQEQGWFGQSPDRHGPAALETGSYAGDSLQDLYALMDREARGEPVYHPTSDIHAAIADREILDQEFAHAGISSGDKPEAAARKLTRFRVTRQAELAHERERAIDADIASIPEEDLRGLLGHGYEPVPDYEYEPGADIGAEHEEPGRAEESDGGPEDWVGVAGENEEGGAPAPGHRETEAESYSTERQDLGQGVTGFTTAKGSRYEVHPDGTTSRNKAARSDIGHEGQSGPQPRSQKTFYVTKAHADELGLFQTHGGPAMAIATRPDGTLGVKYLDGSGAGKFEKRTVAKPADAPAPGLIPVETWKDGTRVHFGNEITEVAKGHVTAEQTVIPGGERSAQQLAAAQEAQGHGRITPRAEQREADEGLFGDGPRKPEPSLFDEPPGMKQGDTPAQGGPISHLDHELTAWLADRNVPHTPTDLSLAIRDYINERGARTGHETLAFYDKGLGNFSHVVTQHRKNGVGFTGSMIDHLVDPKSSVIGHHNHPESRSLSAADLGTLGFPGMEWAVAHISDGNWFGARLSPHWRSGILRTAAVGGMPNITQSRGHIIRMVERLENSLDPHFVKGIKDGQITADEAGDTFSHIVNAILARNGVIEYVTSKEFAPHVEQFAAEVSKAVSPGVDYRPPIPVRYEDGVGKLLEGGGGASAGRPSGPVGDTSDEGGPGPAGVKQPDDRFPSNLNEADDRRDSAADAIAEQLRTAAPGTYRRTLDRMAPPMGDLMFKDPNAVQNFTIRPETLARLDTRSAAIWNAEKAKEYEATAMVDDLRSRISDTMLKLNDAERTRVYAARELDRINGMVRTDTGHSIVARNEKADFAHFSKPGEVVTLTPKETEAYHALTGMFDRAWKNIMEGAVRKIGWAGAWDKENMDANLAHLNHVAETAYDDKGLGRVAQRAAKITASLDVQRRQGYHPLMRFGDYYAHVTPKIGTDMSSTGGFPKTLRFELAERGLKDDVIGGARIGNQSPGYAKEMLDRIQAQYPADKYNVEHGYLAKNPDMLDRVDIPAIEKLMTFMENDMLHGLRQEARDRGMSKTDARADATKRYDDLYGAMIDRLWEKTFKELEAGYKKKSATVPGYSNDFDRALGTYMHWTSRSVADQIHRNTIDDAHTAMATDPRVNYAVKRYWKNWAEYQHSPSNIFNKTVNGMARWGFLTAMGVNPSSSVVVGTHGLFMAGPTLSVGVGMKHAAPAYAKAMNHALGAVKVGRDGLSIPDARSAGRTAAEKAFLQKLDAEGLLHSRAIEDMAALNEKQSSLWGSARSKARKFMDVALSNVSVMDRANRIASALSSYRLASNPKTLAKMDAGWRPNQIWRERASREGVTPESMARFMVPNMVGEYGKPNQAPIERNAGSRMMLGMHGFVTRLLTKMWQLGSMGPDGRRALTWTLGAFWLMAGLDGTPFAEDVQNLADLVWKEATGKDPMIGYRIQAELATLFGKPGADMILHGPASAVGVDFASRLGLGDLISRNWPNAENTLGAYPSILYGRIQSAVADARSGQYEAAAAQFLPGGLRNAAMATIEHSKGMKSRNGRTIVPVQKLTPADTAARALGFTPEKAEHAYEATDYGVRARQSGMRAPPNPIPKDYGKGGRIKAA